MEIKEVKKPLLGVEDIMELTGCGRPNAYGFIRVIKAEIGDASKMPGKVLAKEFNEWAYGKQEQQEREKPKLTNEQIQIISQSIAETILKVM